MTLSERNVRMQSILDMFVAMVYCGTGLIITFAVLIALPQSQMRAFLLPIIGWIVAVCCGIYCLSPTDLIPEIFLGPAGLVDDLGAAAIGLAAARMATHAGKVKSKPAPPSRETAS